MSLIKKLKNAFSSLKKGTKSVVLGTMLASSAYSQEPAIQSEVKSVYAPATAVASTPVAMPLESRKTPPDGRNVQFNWDSQFDTMESTLNFWYSANQGIGKIFDQLSKTQKGDGAVGKRLLSLLGSYWTTYGMQYYGHENAHNIIDRRYGAIKGFEMDWDKWGAMGWPEVNMGLTTQKIIDKMSPDEFFYNHASGLNFNERSSKKSWQNFWTKNEKDFHSANYFFVNKMRDAWYLLSVGMEDRRDYPFDPLPGDAHHNDVDRYVTMLDKKGIDLDKKQYLLQTIISDLFSAHLWKSVEGGWEYVINENQKMNDYSFSIGNTEITPPLISHYITDKGSFFDVSTMINPSSKRPLELSLGFDVDFIGESELDRIRLASQYHLLDLGNFNVSPYIAWDLTKKMQSKGFSAGISAEYDFTKNFGMSVNAGYNVDDVLENLVDLKANGIEVSSGMKYRF